LLGLVKFCFPQHSDPLRLGKQRLAFPSEAATRPGSHGKAADRPGPRWAGKAPRQQRGARLVTRAQARSPSSCQTSSGHLASPESWCQTAGRGAELLRVAKRTPGAWGSERKHRRGARGCVVCRPRACASERREIV